MSENTYTDLSIEEIDKLLAENKEKMNLLQVKIDQTKKEKEKNYTNMVNLMSELSNYQKQYYDYRTMLGSPFFNLSENERDTIEMMMPIYEQKINKLKDDLQNIKLDEVF